MRDIRNGPELYAHAIAIEREAAERYAQFSERMGDLGNDGVAELFARLAAMEGEHLQALLERSRGLALPKVDDDYRWIEAGRPDEAARELVFRLMTPRQALAIALKAELRAEAFFERVYLTAKDPGLRDLAKEMAAEELEHAATIERLIPAMAEPVVDWEKVYDA